MKEKEVPWTWQEVIMELFKDENFLNLTNKTITIWKDVQERRISIEEKRISIWKSDLIFAFVLRFTIMIVLGFSLWFRILSTEIFIILLAVVIGSLFGHSFRR